MDVSQADCLTCHDAHGGLEGTKSSHNAIAHKPYGEGKCNACHQMEAGGTLSKPVPELCWDCHAPAKKKYFEEKVQHKPVYSGKACLNCHSPHTDAAKSMLRKTRPTLCFTCHDKGMMAKEFKHVAAEKDCFNCHLAHSGNEEGLLKTDLKSLCMKCHEKVEKTHMHGMEKSPYVDFVTGEYINCISCHNPHASNNDKLTNGDRRRELCTRCHKKGQHEL